VTPFETTQSWAIVGGGFLGMTLALRLAQQGKRVTLIEAAPFLGGVASAWRLGDIVWDRHYHVTLHSDTHLRSLLAELGLEDELQWRKALTGFFTDSRLHSMSSAVEFLRFPPLNLFEKARLGLTILKASRIRDCSQLENISVEEWLESWSGKGVTQKLWLPLLRAKLGDGYRETSAAFISNTIARMYSARRTSAKAEMFGYVPGGYARILKAFEESLLQSGVSIRLGQPVRSVKRTCAGELRIEFAREFSEDFSRVAVTTAAPLTADLCSTLQIEEKERLRGIRYQGLICASVLLKKPLSPFYITNIADSGLPFTSVIEMSSLVDRNQFGGKSLVYLPKYLNPASSYFGLSFAQIREDFLKGLEQMYPKFSRANVECFQISRVKYLLPVPTMNYSANLLPHATSVPGLYVVNSAQIVDGTLNVNQTVRLAESAAQRIVDTVPVSHPIPALLKHEVASSHS